MEKKKNQGLADNQEGEFILNESGTSVSLDAGIEFPEDKDPTQPAEKNDENDNSSE